DFGPFAVTGPANAFGEQGLEVGVAHGWSVVRGPLSVVSGWTLPILPLSGGINPAKLTNGKAADKNRQTTEPTNENRDQHPSCDGTLRDRHALRAGDCPAPRRKDETVAEVVAQPRQRNGGGWQPRVLWLSDQAASAKRQTAPVGRIPVGVEGRRNRHV